MECIVLYKRNEGCCSELKEFIKLRGDTQARYRELEKIRDFKEYLRDEPKNLPLVISGGDRALNEFINKPGALGIKNPVYYFPSGEDVDFFRDLMPEKSPQGMQARGLRIDGFLKRLPAISVKGRDYRFLNGISCGMDGAAKEIQDRLKSRTGRAHGFRDPALRAGLMKFRPCGATVSVDGRSRSFKKVWIASTLNGGHLCGGMSPVPEQQREKNQGRVSLIVFHDCGRLSSLLLSPYVFKGRCGGLKHLVEVFTGDDISVRFDSKVQLQIDGENLSDVDSYRVRSGKMMEKALPVFKCIPESSAAVI